MQEQKTPIRQGNNARPQAVGLNLEQFLQERKYEPMLKTPTLVCPPVVDEVFGLLGKDLEVVLLQYIPRIDARGQRFCGYCFHVVLHHLDEHMEEIDGFHAESEIYKDPIFFNKIAIIQFHEVEAFNRAAEERGGLDPKSWQELYRYRPLKTVTRASAGEESPGMEEFPTADHAKAFRKIAELGRLHFDREAGKEVEQLCGGIGLRTFPLVTGPSACGKTFLARALAKELDARLNLVSASNWIPRGADAKPCSMISIMRDLLQHERVVLFIDEIDKIEENLEPNGWSLSNRADIYALLDHNILYDELMVQLKRFDANLAKRVSDERMDCQQLAKERLFIVGAGTWQREYQQGNNAQTVGFAERANGEKPLVDMKARLKGNELIAEELRNRFNSDLVELRHPTAAEGRALLDRKGVTALAERLGRMDLIEGIDWPNGGMRNVESVVAELAMDFRKNRAETGGRL